MKEGGNDIAGRAVDAAASQGLAEGMAFGEGFTLIRRLGVGGMGEVWLAREKSLRRDVALKIMRPSPSDAAAAERARRRFEREARILAAAEHPSILPVWRRGEDPSTGLSFYAAKACLLSGADVRRLCSAVFGCPLPRDPARWDAAPRALTDRKSGG